MKPDLLVGRSRALPLGAAAFAVASLSASAAGFSNGDVFAAVASGQVRQYDSALNFIQTLDTTLGGFTTGMAFDGGGNLYVTGFSANAVSKFQPSNGALVGTFGGGYVTPESIVFNTAGEVYVGNVASGIRKFNSSGTPLATLAAAIRVDWMDLAADQSTMLYTQEGRTVKRWNVSSDTAMSDFATLPGPGEAYALRVLSSGGVLVADGDNVKRLDSSGNVVQTYDAGSNDSWFALNLAPDGTSFLTGDFSSGDIYRFDIASGAVLDSVNTGTGSSTLFGLAVAGEITVGGPPPSEVPEASTWVSIVGLAMPAGYLVRRRLLRSA